MLKTGIKKRQNSDVEKWKIHNFFVVYVNIFKTTHGPYVNISKHFADHLPTPKCKHNLWRLPNGPLTLSARDRLLLTIDFSRQNT